jgi:all-trans-retinol 13,14-reductase
MEKQYDVIVVGAGVSGLLSALTLAKERKRVLVLEKDRFIGGNLRTYSVDGFTVDTGLHAITHVDNGPLTKIMDEYFDVIPRFLPFGDYRIRTKSKLVVFPWTMQAWVNFDVLPQKDRIAITSLLGQTVAFNIFNKADTNQSVYDFLKGMDFAQKTWKFIDTMCYFMSGKNMMKCPVWRILKGARYKEETESEFIGDKVVGKITSFAKLVSYDGSYHQAYPRAGVGAITDSIVNSFPRGMVEVRTGEKATSIDGSAKASGVTTKEGEYRAESVVYSGYMKDLPALTDALPKKYEQDLKTLEQSTSITVWLGLDHRMREFDYSGSEIWFEEGKAYWAMPTSNYNESFAPPGKQLVGFTSIIEGEPRGEERALMDSIYSSLPRIERHVEFRHVQVTIPEKAAITVGSRFPNPKSPLRGLYLVGTDTDVRSMGVTRASFSVLEMLEAMRKDGTLPEKAKQRFKNSKHVRINK